MRCVNTSRSSLDDSGRRYALDVAAMLRGVSVTLCKCLEQRENILQHARQEKCALEQLRACP